MIAKPLAAAGLFATLLAVTTAAAAPAAFADETGSIGAAFVSLPDSDTVQQVFKPDAPKIVLHAELLEVPPGTRIAAAWIAENIPAAPPDFAIESGSVTAQGEDEVEFSLAEPPGGWAVGDYRVDLTLAGAPAKSVHFKIAP